MGDPAMYPEIRSARNIYALQRLPRDFTADVQARKQWVDNNLTYLDAVIVLGVTLATKVPVGPSFLFPQASWSYA
eukprot:scaffold26267_cov109-Isochrysis_galbana.AAC.5